MTLSALGNAPLAAKALSIGYTQNRQQRVVADGINLTLRPGELTCLIGPNGAGKSTLMRTLAGMQPPLAGEVQMDGVDLHHVPPAELAKRLAVVLTERVDVGNLSAYALVALGRHPYTDWRGRLSAHDHSAVASALAQVKATALAQRAVNELSDGERQRVMIARALAQLAGGETALDDESAQPNKILILDEPTAFLDLPRRVEMMQLLGTLARMTRAAVLLSTHDLDLALRVADRLWLLSATGRFDQGPPEELVLNGAVAATFQSEGVEFDAGAGSFKLQRHPCGPIRVIGDELPEDDVTVSWTVRGLERIGYEVVGADGETHSTVTVAFRDERYQWRVSTPYDEQQFDSLAAMLERVKSP